MKRIYVRGPVLTRSGYGEQARFALRALRSRPDLFDVYIEPINWGKTNWIADDTEERKWIDQAVFKASQAAQNRVNFDATLQITIPNEFEKLAPINIGYTAGIETNRIDPGWIEKSNIMDKLIVVSNHAKSGFDNSVYSAQNNKTGEVNNNFRCLTPVDAVNYAVRDFEPENIDLKLDYDFNFLVVSQWGIRKNMKKTIQWFVNEFHQEEVGLVLKTNIMDNSIMDRERTNNKLMELLQAEDDKKSGRKCKVYLLHGDMTEGELTSLYQHKQIKSLINLAHGEGFGLPMFEAAYNTLPVVTIGWGGQTDFLYAPYHDKKKNKTYIKPYFANVSYDIKPVQKEAVWKGVLKEDSMWAYPHQQKYKDKIRDIYKNYGVYKKQSKLLNDHLRENFSEEKMYAKFVDSIISTFGEDSEEEENEQVMVL